MICEVLSLIHLLHLKNTSIFEQLQIEEALLRADNRNWCIINEGSSKAIVMGISGKIDELIDKQKLSLKSVPVIRRFSGGGTVFIDPNTLFVSFIMNQNFASIPSYPKHISEWTKQFYMPFFQPLAFNLQEYDYAIGQHKCGGNAQSIIKERWLHHSSFLWDFESNNMDYLLYPKKVPEYRQGRSHLDFLCKLREFNHWDNKEHFFEAFKGYIKSQFEVTEVPFESIKDILIKPHRKATHKECG